MRPAFLTLLMHSGPRTGPSGDVGAGAGSYLVLKHAISGSRSFANRSSVAPCKRNDRIAVWINLGASYF